MPNNDLIIVNNYYPIGYFSTTGVDQVAATGTDQYWASVEKFAPEQDWIEYDFGRLRPFNFIDFEIAQKPLDFLVEYDDEGEWVPVEVHELFPVTPSVSFRASSENPWHYFEMHLKLVQTRKVRITFTRRTDPFPFSDTAPFPWSIEIRNLRLMHVIPDEDSFLVDVGEDILGNSYITSLERFNADKVADGNTTTFWQSQPNPSPYAVECLYFDLRGASTPVEMDYLNHLTMDNLNPRDMENMESYAADGSMVDEIYIDPITFGPSMHIYYSNDDEAAWDYKLWTPVPRHYTLKKGYHALPAPTYAKYVKLEFSNLAATPYNLVEYPSVPPVEYRKFPTWVQNYFNEQYISQVDNSGIYNPVDRVSIDPLELGFRRPEDYLEVGSLNTRRFPAKDDTTEEIKDFIDELTQRDSVTAETQRQTESQIEYRPSFVWQQDLVDQLPGSHALTRVAKDGDTGWNAEETPVTEPAPVLQSVPNLSEAEAEKHTPIMWFPRRCRHGYQIVRTTRPSKIAYFAAVREVSFHRRNYEVQFDEPFYIETLDDSAHTDVNDFTQEDWRFMVQK